MRKCVYLAAACAALSVAGVASAAPFFADSFDSGASSGNWLTTTVASAGDTTTFGFDYSTKGVPEAPNSPSGATATSGLFVQTNKNLTAGVINGLNVTAASGGVAINFSGDIRLAFDMWMGVPSPLTNTTELSLFGINTDGAGVNARTGSTPSASDGVWYHLAGEGGFGGTSSTPNSRDYVNYIDTTVVDRKDNAEEPFLSLFPNGPLAGAPGNGWVNVEIMEVAGNVELRMNGTVISSVANTGPADGSVFVGYQDPFSGSLGDNNALFAVFDNVQVTAVPEPTALGLLGVAGLAALRRRR